MRALLVGPDYEDNMSVRYLASSLEAAGHEARVTAFNSAAGVDAVVRRARGFDMVGLSIAFQVRAREFLGLADALKADGAPLVVAGGHYASCAAEDLLAHHPSIDLIVVHEGEQTLVDLAEMGYERGRLNEVEGIVFRSDDGTIVRTPRRKVLEDLDQLPVPDRSGSIHFFSGVPTAYLIGSRGCVANCDYCCIVTLHRMAQGRRFRQRSPELVADEMAHLYHGSGIRHFIFHDDNFLVPSVPANHRRLDAFDKAFRERGLKDMGLTLKGRPADATPSVLGKLKEMGLLRIFIGVESSSPEGLSAIGRDQTVEQAEQALLSCAELGISAQYTIMAFHPDATLSTLRSDFDFMRRYSDYPLNFARTEIYSGTPLEQRMIQEGRARGDYLARSYGFRDPEVERAWCAVRRVFRERAWATRGLQDRTIGLDHLSAVLGHFYRGREVRRFREKIRDWRLEANRDLVDLLEEALEVSVRCTGSDLEREIESMIERERRTREPLMRTALDLKAELEALCRAEIGLGSDGRVLVSPTRDRARHAAAAVLALSIMACGGTRHDGIAEAAPDPLYDEERRVLTPEEEEARRQREEQERLQLEHDGIAEAAPDPLYHDGIAEAAPDPLLHDGIAEAAPDPLYHDGIAEAAPDPLYDEGPGGGGHGVVQPQPVGRAAVRGRIDSAQGPVTATIRVPSRGLTLRSRSNGNFALDLPPGNHQVIFSVPGFRDERRTVVVGERGVTIVNVRMGR